MSQQAHRGKSGEHVQLYLTLTEDMCVIYSAKSKTDRITAEPRTVQKDENKILI